MDGDWVTDHTAPREFDESGIENNVLAPEQIVSEAPAATIAIMNSAAPESTTAALAANAPLEKRDGTSDLPGTFPETPATELNNEGAFRVNPLPAAAGAVNPISLAPGELIPEHLVGGSTSNHVHLDPESYEKSDTLPGTSLPPTPQLAPCNTTLINLT